MFAAVCLSVIVQTSKLTFSPPFENLEEVLTLYYSSHADEAACKCVCRIFLFTGLVSTGIAQCQMSESVR